MRSTGLWIHLSRSSVRARVRQETSGHTGCAGWCPLSSRGSPGILMTTHPHLTQVGAQPAQPSLGKWSSWDPPAQNSRMESYRSQLGQARQPKQYQVPKTRAIRNWEFLFGEPSVGTHPLNCQAQPPALGPELSATSKKSHSRPAKGTEPKGNCPVIPRLRPQLPPPGGQLLHWLGRQEEAQFPSLSLAVAMPSSCLPAPSP